MGNWVIIIEGTGPHHNGNSYDADAVAKHVVSFLSKHHTIERASITHSAREVINPDRALKTYGLKDDGVEE